MTSETVIYNHNHVEPTEEDPLREDGQSLNKEDTQTCGAKFKLFIKNITLEPPLFLFIIASMLNSTASGNLNLEKACRVNLNYSDTICDALRAQDVNASNEYERVVQSLVADSLIWKTYISATLPAVIALFAGAFIDKTGHRKVFMIMSMIGQLLSSVNSIINVYFMYQLNLQVLVFSGAIIDGLTGGMTFCFMVAFTFISVITTEENRTFRMGLVSFCLTVAFPISAAISGVLLKAIDYYGCFGLTCGLHMLNVLYLILVVRDPPRSKEQKKHDRCGCWHLTRLFFNLANILNSAKVIIRPGPDKRVLRLCLLLCVGMVLFGPMYGELSIMYMMTRYRFGWNEVQYSWFQTYTAIISIIGTIFSLGFLSKFLGWHDSLLGVISILSKVASSFVFCFAPNAQIFYIAPLVEILGGTSQLVIRSILSKLVEPDELGKVNSVTGLVENLMPLLYVPLYTKVYTATMEVLPGAVFLLGAGLTLPAVAVLLWWFIDYRQQLSRTPKSQPI